MPRECIPNTIFRRKKLCINPPRRGSIQVNSHEHIHECMWGKISLKWKVIPGSTPKFDQLFLIPHCLLLSKQKQPNTYTSPSSFISMLSYFMNLHTKKIECKTYPIINCFYCRSCNGHKRKLFPTSHVDNTVY